jgi:hypothetical protein
MTKVSAEIIARILLHQGQNLNIGDPVLAWDTDGDANDDFQVGIFKGYDHSFVNGTRPFLVKLSLDIVHYAYVKPIPKKYLGFIKLPTIAPEMPERPINYEEGSNG